VDKETAFSVAKSYSAAVAKRYATRYVVMFGSYVYGEPHEYSDIDIAVIYDGFTGNRFPFGGELLRLAHDMFKGDDAPLIEPHLMDLQRDKLGFAREVLRIGTILYDSSKEGG
jgi:predicted nucleotidyltransferase